MKKKQDIQVQNVFVTVQVATEKPLREFSHPSWHDTPNHGYKSIQAVGENPGPAGKYFYEVEFLCEGSMNPGVLGNHLSIFTKRDSEK